MARIEKYVQIKTLRHAKKDEIVCACYPKPIKNVSGKKHETKIQVAAIDAKDGKCKLFVWREVEI